jgi:UDP-2,4-diacetamido-2,4,6-trideoxy-beta-L-altropyranose hydrolase|tara:strand:- start:21350 stop:22957 length:1608 start_codon:yes stop_codon:yes gene_type:complete
LSLRVQEVELEVELMKVKVAVRADASISIGSGHVHRCLTLTDQLLRSNYEVTFFTRPNNGHLVNLIKSRGCHVRLLPLILDESFNGDDCVTWPESYAIEDARQTILCAGDELYDWMIVDHYGVDSPWEIFTKGIYKHLLVLDDLANRQHDCNILVDQNLGRKSSHYQALLNEKAVRLCGSEYALLRPEFSVSRDISLERRKFHGLQSILIFMGGTDVNNITCRVLEALWDNHLKAFKKIYVVMGSNAPSLNNVRDLLGKFNCSTELLIDTDKIHEYMTLSDISVGGAGGAAWERCCLGLPSLIVTIAENQVEGSKALVRAGAAQSITQLELKKRMLTKTILLLENNGELSNMSANAASICDGSGASRVLAEMCKVDFSLLMPRKANSSDEALLLIWANDPLTRQNAVNQDVISEESHSLWFKRKMADASHCIIYIVSLPDGNNLGQVRFDMADDGWLIDYSMDFSYRGMGLGSAMLSSAVTALANLFPGQFVKGLVKQKNNASLRVFEKCQFVRQEQTDYNVVTFFKKLRSSKND